MECRNCCKVFCSNRNDNPDFNCDHGISYLEANILEQPKHIEHNKFDFNFGVTMDEACKTVAKFQKALLKSEVI